MDILNLVYVYLKKVTCALGKIQITNVEAEHGLSEEQLIKKRKVRSSVYGVTVNG